MGTRWGGSDPQARPSPPPAPKPHPGRCRRRVLAPREREGGPVTAGLGPGKGRGVRELLGFPKNRGGQSPGPREEQVRRSPRPPGPGGGGVGFGGCGRRPGAGAGRGRGRRGGSGRRGGRGHTGAAAAEEGAAEPRRRLAAWSWAAERRQPQPLPPDRPAQRGSPLLPGSLGPCSPRRPSVRPWSGAAASSCSCRWCWG